MNKLEKKYEELVKEYKRLINLSASKQFFDIPYVRSLESEIAALKEQQSSNVSDEEKSYPEEFVRFLIRGYHIEWRNSSVKQVYTYYKENIKEDL